MPPRVLLLLTHRSYRAEAFLAALSAMDVEVTVGTDREQVLAALNPAGNLSLDFADLAAAVDTARAFHKRFPIDSVMAAEDDGVLLAAAIAEALGLPSNPPQAVLAARDKLRSRRLWQAAGLATPRFASFAIEDDPERVATEIRYPCVLKPLALAASRGVMRADDPKAFVRAWNRLAAILARPEIAETGDEWAGQLLVEDYLPGEEYAVEGILTGGQLQVLAIFDKPDPLIGPFFEETIYLTPSGLPPADRGPLVDCVQQATRALGLVEGPIHAELRLGEIGPVMLEIAPRSIGGLCSKSLRFVESGAASDAGPAEAHLEDQSTWISLESLILRHALDEDVGELARERRASGVMMIPIPRAGRLVEVRGAARARALASIEELQLTLAPGTWVEPPPEGAQYLGFIFARAEQPAQVELALRKAHEALEFLIEPSENPGSSGS